MSPGGPRRRTGRRVDPDIQKQLQSRTLAREAVFKWKELTDAGKLKEAKKVAREAIRLEKEWRRYGGKGPLT